MGDPKPPPETPSSALTAVVSLMPLHGLAPLSVTADASSSRDPRGRPLQYRFDFGDGAATGPQAGATASHVYGTGDWLLTVVVSNDLGATDTVRVPVTGGSPPSAALHAAPAFGAAPLAVTLDASSSSDPDHQPLAYWFDFGDGTSVGPLSQPWVTHAYPAGLWFPTLTVTDRDGATATADEVVAVNTLPVAALRLTPATGVAPQVVMVDASDSHDPDGDGLVYAYDFGDGATAGPTPDAAIAHTFAAGTWMVRVTASDEWGAASSASATLVVSRPPNRLPLPSLTLAPTSGTAPLSVTANAAASSDPDGSVVWYSFDFGDGVVVGPQSQPTATHVYAAGTWQAHVTVADDSGATAVANIAVAVNARPVAALAAIPAQGTAPLAVTLDAAGSSDPEGGRLTYRFVFGDGASVGPQAARTASHAYPVGNWIASVTAFDSTGASAIATTAISSNGAPVARLTASPASGTTPLSVLASGSTSTDPEGQALTYRFAFGDGVSVGPQSQPTASHTYAAGNWALMLTITDALGASDTSAIPIQVSPPPNQPPVASLSATPASGIAPLTVTLDARASWDPEGGTLHYRFDFGDGTAPLGPQVQPTAAHAYAQGSWIATVTVTDSMGSAAPATAAIAAASSNQPPTPMIAVRLGALHPDSGFVALLTNPTPVVSIPSAPRPGHLTWTTDPAFGTRLERITALSSMPLSTATGGGTWGSDARHHYSKDQPWNSDGTLLAIQNSGAPRQVFLDGATYAPRYEECSTYPRGDDRWHPSRQYPNVRINAKGNELMWWDVLTCTKLRSWTLPFAVNGIGDEEGNPSLDGRYLALCDSTRMFVVDMDPQPPYAAYPSPRIGPVYDYVADCGFPSCRMGWVSVSPSGKYVVCKYGEDHPRVFDLDPATLALTPRLMSAGSPRCLGTAAGGFVYDLGHCDMTLNPFDHNEDVLIGQEHCGLRGTYVAGKLVGAVVMARLSDGAITPLTDPANEAQAHHISAQNLDRPGWAYVGYYRDPGKRFSDEIVALKLDGSKAVQRFAHKRSVSTDCYRCEPHAVPSRDGRRVIWASNWAIDCSSCGSPAEIKDYLIDARSDTLTGQRWVAPAVVTADASASHDPDGVVATYQFDFGDGVLVGPQSQPTASHTYAAGTWTVRVTVADNQGASRTANTVVTITTPPVDRAPVVTAPTIASANRLDTLRVQVWVSDPDGNAIATLAANLSALPPGNGAQFVVQPNATTGTLTWVPTATGGPYAIVFTASNAEVGRDTTMITVTTSNPPPVARVVVSSTLGVAPFAVSLDASTSSDANGAIASYLFDFGDGMIAGPQASALATHVYAAGSWTATVIAFDAQGASGRVTKAITSLYDLVGNPSFELSTTGWNANGGSTILRAPGGVDGGYCIEMQGPAGLATFGVNDSPNWVADVVAGDRYRFEAWVRSASHVGSAKLRVREYLNGLQQGATATSSGVTLAHAWKKLSMDYTTLTAGSTLDFQVFDAPVASGETFQADLVTIVELPPGAPMLSGPPAETETSATPEPGVAPFESRVTLFPNPPRAGATLRFETRARGPARVELFDVHGRAIASPLSDPDLPAGSHAIRVADPRGASRLEPGIYFYRVRTVHGTTHGRFAVLE